MLMHEKKPIQENNYLQLVQDLRDACASTRSGVLSRISDENRYIQGFYLAFINNGRVQQSEFLNKLLVLKESIYDATVENVKTFSRYSFKKSEEEQAKNYDEFCKEHMIKFLASFMVKPKCFKVPDGNGKSLNTDRLTIKHTVGQTLYVLPTYKDKAWFLHALLTNSPELQVKVTAKEITFTMKGADLKKAVKTETALQTEQLTKLCKVIEGKEYLYYGETLEEPSKSILKNQFFVDREDEEDDRDPNFGRTIMDFDYSYWAGELVKLDIEAYEEELAKYLRSLEKVKARKKLVMELMPPVPEAIDKFFGFMQENFTLYLTSAHPTLKGLASLVSEGVSKERMIEIYNRVLSSK
jgi:hypothetical protein